MDHGLFPGVRTRPGPPSPLLRAMWADAAYQDVNWDEDSFDRTRDLALMRRGYLVVRVGYHHVVNEWQLVEQTVRAVLIRREHVWSAAHRREGLVP